MSQILPKLKIFGVSYPDTATAIIDLLAEEKTALRRRFSKALPESTSSHFIRRTLYQLLQLGIISVSLDGEYRLLYPVKAIKALKPIQMSKVEHLILRLMHDRGDVTAADIFDAYGILRAQFLNTAARLIERGLISTYDKPMNESTARFRRYYTFNNTPTE